jgi:hypothetical protein
MEFVGTLGLNKTFIKKYQVIEPTGSWPWNSPLGWSSAILSITGAAKLTDIIEPFKRTRGRNTLGSGREERAYVGKEG